MSTPPRVALADASRLRPPARCTSARWSLPSRVTPTRAATAANGALRIDDVDVTRTRNDAAGDIVATLARYGFAMGRRRRAPVAAHAAATRRRSRALRARGLVFACACTRADLAHAPLGEPASASIRERAATPRSPRVRRIAWRLRVGDAAITFTDRVQGVRHQALATDVGDFVVRRSDGLFAYQLAVVVDDADDGITEVVRGADLLASTPRQIRCSACWDCRTPAYLHVPVGDQSRAATSCRSRRARARSTATRWRRSRRRGGSSTSRLPVAAPASPAQFWALAIRAWSPARVPPVEHAALPGALALTRKMTGSPRQSAMRRLSRSTRMTTLVAVRKGRTITIAADSLTTFGDTRLSAEFDKSYEKILHHNGTYIGLCGSRRAPARVREPAARTARTSTSRARRAIFETLRKLHPILKEQHFLNPKEDEDDPYESTQITALIANRTASSASTRCAKCSSTRGSGRWAPGREFAIGAMHVLYGVSRLPKPSRARASRAARRSTRTPSLPMTIYSLQAADDA